MAELVASVAFVVKVGTAAIQAQVLVTAQK